jgi:hypothetical protein
MATYLDENHTEDAVLRDQSLSQELESQLYTEQRDGREGWSVTYTAQGFVGILW